VHRATTEPPGEVSSALVEDGDGVLDGLEGGVVRDGEVEGVDGPDECVGVEPELDRAVADGCVVDVAWPPLLEPLGPAAACEVAAPPEVGMPTAESAALTCAGESASTTEESPTAPRPTATAARATAGAATASTTHPTAYLPRPTHPWSLASGHSGLRPP
jgi:hypothetical protein